MTITGRPEIETSFPINNRIQFLDAT